MTEGRTKQTLNAPLPFYGGCIKSNFKYISSQSCIYVSNIIFVFKFWVSANFTPCIILYYSAHTFQIAGIQYTFIIITLFKNSAISSDCLLSILLVPCSGDCTLTIYKI